MFGRLLRGTNPINESFVSPQSEPMPQPSMRGMFGRAIQGAMKPGGLADFALGGYSRVDDRLAQVKAAQDKAKQGAALQRLLGSMTPTKASPMGPTMSGDPMGNPARTPSMQDMMPALMEAQAAGVDVRPYMQMGEAMQPDKAQVFNMGDGYLGVVDPGKDPRFVGAPSVGQHQAYNEARTNAQEALAGVRGNQGQYYGAKARQPYAPPRPVASKGGGSALEAIAAELRRRGRNVD